VGMNVKPPSESNVYVGLHHHSHACSSSMHIRTVSYTNIVFINGNNKRSCTYVLCIFASKIKNMTKLISSIAYSQGLETGA